MSATCTGGAGGGIYATDLLSLGCDSLDTLMLFFIPFIVVTQMQQWPLGGAKKESLKLHPGASPNHGETWHLRCVYRTSVRLILVSHSGATSELPLNLFKARLEHS